MTRLVKRSRKQARISVTPSKKQAVTRSKMPDACRKNIEKGGKVLEEQLRYGIGQLREGKIGTWTPSETPSRKCSVLPKNIDRAINEAGAV